MLWNVFTFASLVFHLIFEDILSYKPALYLKYSTDLKKAGQAVQVRSDALTKPRDVNPEVTKLSGQAI